jgi:formate dehydrogenase accessory protein FdhE
VKSRGVADGAAAAFEARAARAEVLAVSTPAAAEPLRFAASLYRVQGGLATNAERLHAAQPLTGRLETDADRLLDGLGALLDFASLHGPAGLAAQARSRSSETRTVARDRLLSWWQGESSSAEDYLTRALLRPYAEVLTRLGVRLDRRLEPGRCPTCGGLPWIAARRAESEADGARRSLGCALCGGEWTFGRLRCPGCGEEDAAKLPLFRTEPHPAVRIEACETCRCYVKSLDLTTDGRIVPEVDDLVSLSMDLWAGSQGFTRLEPGLAGSLPAGA